MFSPGSIDIRQFAEEAAAYRRLNCRVGLQVKVLHVVFSPHPGGPQIRNRTEVMRAYEGADRDKLTQSDPVRSARPLLQLREAPIDGGRNLGTSKHNGSAAHCGHAF